MIKDIDYSGLLENTSINKGLIVLTGFKKQPISSAISYVFESEVNADEYLQENKKERRRILSKEIMSKCSSKIYYCYFEDLLCIPDFIDGLSTFIDIIYLKNPYLLNIIPTNFNFSPYEINDENSEDAKSIESFETVLLNDFINDCLKSLIGQVYKKDTSYFFVPLNEIPSNNLRISEDIIIKKSSNNNKIYLSNDESSYINLLSILNTSPNEYSIVFDSKQTEIKYLSVLKNLIYYCDVKISIFDNDYSEPNKIRPECKTILENIWHYPNFRTIKIYPELKNEKPIPTKDIS
ncbi:hypothetical protein HMPREF1325_1889, partial [Treponema socranskii subsp. socranskii VPI DR56BR1116 = ATCC 35536]